MSGPDPEAANDAPGASAPTTRAGLEYGLIAVFGAIALAVLVFLHLASEVGEGETGTFDHAILVGLRNANDLAQPIGPRWLQYAMLDFTALGGTSVLTLVTILGMGFLFAKRRWSRAGFLVLATGGGAILSGLLKANYQRPRPDFVAHLVAVDTTSFPSGHAMNSAIVYLTLGVLLARAVPERRIKAYLLGVAVLLTLIVGASRVYLGVHYPTDVLGGWTVGAAWAGLCSAGAEAMRRYHARRS